MLTLYDFDGSGNGYKVALLLNLLDQPYRRVEVNILEGESRTEAFLRDISPVGKIPVLGFDDGRKLFESNAILTYLADGTVYIPNDLFQRAQMFSWLFWEQYSHEPSIAVVRFARHFKTLTPEQEDALQPKIDFGYECLGLLESQLKRSDWLVGDRVTLADIALYPYTSVAEEGDFNLSRYPAIRAWFDRIAALPGYRSMDYRPD
ncbi:MAG: glutathione S-transferase family protein [Alphaproteobacteria bacterium]|nr:glutathione S-transferase family protein [Alphaproteobacteria bacterium]